MMLNPDIILWKLRADAEMKRAEEAEMRYAAYYKFAEGNLKQLEAQIKDADKVHAETLFEFHEMKARAEAAEKHVRDQQELKVRYFDERNDWKARAEAAEKRVAYLESLMGGRASTILLGASHEP